MDIQELNQKVEDYAQEGLKLLKNLESEGLKRLREVTERIDSLERRCRREAVEPERFQVLYMDEDGDYQTTSEYYASEEEFRRDYDEDFKFIQLLK